MEKVPAFCQQFFLMFSGCVLSKAVGVMAACVWYKVIQNVCFAEQLAAVKLAVKMLKVLNNNHLVKIRSLNYNGPHNNCQIDYK